MDWKECTASRMAKNVKPDKNLISSLKRIAAEKVKSSEALPAEHFYSRISLLYDALRSLLECLALQEGYKIYNHECYTSFLKEILRLSREAGSFDRLRIVRNGINYYGREIDSGEAGAVIKELKELTAKITQRLR